MTAAARRRASVCLSSNTPSGAYTSIIGIVSLLLAPRRVSVAGVRRSLIRICDPPARRRLTQMDYGAPIAAMPCLMTNGEVRSPRRDNDHDHINDADDRPGTWGLRRRVRVRRRDPRAAKHRPH